MEFIGTFLSKSRLPVSNIYNESHREVRPGVEAENNDMLRLHLNLSESLNKSTEKSQEKISIFYVTIITIVSTIALLKEKIKTSNISFLDFLNSHHLFPGME